MYNQTSLPFTDFTQHHRDIYLRLKLRALDRKLQQPSQHMSGGVKPIHAQALLGEKSLLEAPLLMVPGLSELHQKLEMMNKKLISNAWDISQV